MKRSPGRPPKYVGEERNRIVGLLVKHKNATKVRKILTARNLVTVSKAEKELAATRREAGFEKPVNISMPTLLKLAEEAEVGLVVGRPKAA